MTVDICAESGADSYSHLPATNALKGKMDFTMAFGLSDIKSQLGLVYPGFVQKSGYDRLPI